MNCLYMLAFNIRNYRYPFFSPISHFHSLTLSDSLSLSLSLSHKHTHTHSLSLSLLFMCLLCYLCYCFSHQHVHETQISLSVYHFLTLDTFDCFFVQVCILQYTKLLYKQLPCMLWH